MIEGIVTVFAVLAIFAVVVALLTVYVWRADPHQFAMWKTELASFWWSLRGRTEDDEEVTPRLARMPRLRLELTSAPEPEHEEPAPPVVPVRPSPSARLEYWVDVEAAGVSR
jgi:Na+-transporting methylmalonyl-CoA/oxaloacetate decarboxylase gamma subunit